MAGIQKTIYVYDDFSCNEPLLMGTLYVSVIKGGESYSFEYNNEWLKKTGLMLTLDPELLPYSGRQYPSGKKIFGVFADASPDRWGRVLMNKRERILAEKEGRKPSKLHDSDYLRNHAFILTGNGWSLSPLYDVNPVPYGDELSLNVDEEDNRISIDLAIQTAMRFGIKKSDAESYAKDIIKIVREHWVSLASGYGLTRRQIEEMKPAFSACYE